MTSRLTEIPYRRDSSELFNLIANEPWSIFLDSGYPNIDRGRYDFISSRPYKTLTTYGNETFIDDGESVRCSEQDPFELIKSSLGKHIHNLTDLPFCGGAMGYFAYDLGRRIESLPDSTRQDVVIPDMAIGLYDWVIVVDHHKRQSWLIGQDRDIRTEQQWTQLSDLFHSEGHQRMEKYTVHSSIKANMDKNEYANNFNKIKNYIREGDCYQVNLAQRFSVDVQGDPWDIYLQLRKNNPAPFAAYFNSPDGSILSSSPERFLKVNNEIVETKPIKGTIRRGTYANEDKALAEQLLESEKDRAENLMIVDLMRNDISKNCATGSVAVPKLFALESYATVHHLVSTVTGRLKNDRQALDLLRGCFPGGSITGAPKLRAMEIIEELEPHRRNVYCGSLGYIGYDGNMDSNIAIRTLVYHKDKVYCWAGGGIVADSKVDSEYQECFEKAAAMLKLFQGNKSDDVGR
ncbi:MAG: aminodeoxychorismate synthase component I [Gammaproteobacteria bacterium]|jgi:para-aminobenzoate synthetase component I|nr:aminodeoxychorismate synthase component I [Gammaproteobacteria bacterium]